MEILFFIPFIVLLLIAFSMVIQGWMIIHERHGYTERPNIKRHPEISEMKGDTGVLMTVNFDRLPDDDYHQLQKRIDKMKLDELFDEPSSYYDYEEDDDD